MKIALMLFSVLAVVSALAAGDCEAGWIENGNALAGRSARPSSPKAVSDGSGGMLIAFGDCRDAVDRVLMQRVNSAGAALWAMSGVALSNSPHGQFAPEIAPDGAGGAVVIWVEYKDASPSVHAQRVNASGVIQWGAGGVTVCADPAVPANYRIASDGAGGAIATWEDYGSSTADIFAQRLSADGAAQWTENGVGICTYAGNQTAPAIASDGAGGAIIAWKDERLTNPNAPDIYAQRVNASGVPQWAADGIPLCTAANFQESVSIVPDGAGGAIMVWYDGRGYPDEAIYAQRLNAAGAAQWTVDGVAVLTPTLGGSVPQMIADGAGGAIVAWSDARNGNSDIFVQRLDGSGASQWGANGAALCTAIDDQYDPQLASDGAGGAIVAWSDYRHQRSDLYARRVSGAGAPQWTADGIELCRGQSGFRYSPQVVPDGAGGAIMAWFDGRGVGDIYAQRASSSGATQWQENGLPLFGAGNEDFQRIVSDGAGGAIVVWEDTRNGDYDIYAQRVSGSGAMLWGPRGAAVCVHVGDQTMPRVVSDGAGGAIVAWQDYRAGNLDIYAQRVSASGAIQWTSVGVAVCTEQGDQVGPWIVSDDAGGAIVAWQDFRGSDSDVYAQRLSASGAVQWASGGVGICTAMGAQYPPATVADGAGGAIVTWRDSRTDQGDIYAQRVNAAGAVQWLAGGVALCAAAGEQGYPLAASDGAGGAIVAWEDQRDGNRDVYAQRVNASGARPWAADGVVVNNAPGDQLQPELVSDGGGGAIVAWNDLKDGYNYDVYAQRVSSSGDIQWGAGGAAVCVQPANQEAPMIIPDDAGGAIVTWMDYRNGDYDIYAQRLNAAGETQWPDDGIALTRVLGDQSIPVPAPDGAGGAIVAWGDCRCSTSIVYAQRVRASGDLVATLLQSFAAAPAGGGIRLDWTVSQIDEGARFFVMRASAPAWAYEELDGAAIERQGLSFAFTDETCLPGSAYKYCVDVAALGSERKTLFETQAISTPRLPLTLYQNHPNPFNPSTTLRFYLPETGKATLDVYDVVGRRVARLVDGTVERGYHEAVWNGRNGSGAPCASGVYFAKLKAGKAAVSRKMLLLR